MLYNVVLVSNAQHHISDICTHVSPPSDSFPTRPHPTPLGHQEALSRAPRAMQQLSTSYPFYTGSCIWGLLSGSVARNLPANARIVGSIPESGRSPGGAWSFLWLSNITLYVNTISSTFRLLPCPGYCK